MAVYSMAFLAVLFPLLRRVGLEVEGVGDHDVTVARGRGKRCFLNSIQNTQFGKGLARQTLQFLTPGMMDLMPVAIASRLSSP